MQNIRAFSKSFLVGLPIRANVAGCIALCIATFGCGGPAYEYDSVVTGTVTIDGELAKSGTVTFHPAEEGGRPAIGRIHHDGSYSLRTGQGDLGESDGGTIQSGDYIVTVSVTGLPPKGAVVGEGGPPMAGPLLVHSKYVSKETSDLRRTVEPGSNVVVLNLEGPEPDDTDEPIDEANTEDPAEAATAPSATQDDSDQPGELSNSADDSTSPLDSESQSDQSGDPTSEEQR